MCKQLDNKNLQCYSEGALFFLFSYHSSGIIAFFTYVHIAVIRAACSNVCGNKRATTEKKTVKWRCDGYVERGLLTFHHIHAYIIYNEIKSSAVEQKKLLLLMLCDRVLFSVSFPSAVVAKEQHVHKKKVSSRRAPRVVDAAFDYARGNI